MNKIDAVLIGNAIVDLISKTSDEELKALDVNKGTMTLVDGARSEALYQAMKSPQQFAGGSAANTAFVMAALGCNTHYISKVGEDELGRFYAEDLAKIGVRFDTPVSKDQATGRSMILITPDGERSMNTYLGASEFLAEGDIDFDSIWEANYLYLEGYRFDGTESQAAFKQAVERCRANDGFASLTLSDPFCVERHRDAFRELIEHGINIVFSNEAELVAYKQKSNLQEACEAVRDHGMRFVCTAGADGVYVIHEGQIDHVPAEAVDVVDATGAGDYFAGAFLAALIEGKTFKEAAVWGNRAAGAIIQVVGTRVDGDLRAIVEG